MGDTLRRGANESWIPGGNTANRSTVTMHQEARNDDSHGLA
jgi:hypothetical protein